MARTRAPSAHAGHYRSQAGLATRDRELPAALLRTGPKALTGCSVRPCGSRPRAR